jgi:alpha-D-xyloside xylohydrolase
MDAEFLEHESIKLQRGFECLSSFSLEEKTTQGVKLATLAGTLDISFYSPGIIRFYLQAIPQTDYGLLVQEPGTVDFEIRNSDEDHSVYLKSQDMSLEILNSPLRLALKIGNKTLLESATDRNIQGALRFMPFAQSKEGWLISLALKNNEPVYGLGEKFDSINHRGCLINSWNRDALGVNAEESYKNTPFAWSPEGWGLFVHTPARVTHGVGYAIWSHRSYILKVSDPNLDIFLIAGESPADILRKYTYLTGRSPLPPIWSYGVWMSRAYYRTADEIIHVANKLRERKIPSEVLLLDGRAWHKAETRFDFSWDSDRYPDPATFVARLKEIGFRLSLWEYPYLSALNPLFSELVQRGYLLRTRSGRPYLHRWLPETLDSYLPHLMPSGIIDLTNPEAYNWYREMHESLFKIGVAVMKTDYGEAIPDSDDIVAYNGDTGRRLHNVYAHLYNRCVFEASQMYGQGNAMVWGRSGWIGSQRYPIQWGGDPQCDWEGLASSIRGGLSWGMSGAPFYAHDIGGFAAGMPDPELYIRWAQAGIFCSHTRFHGIGAREPWEYGQNAEDIVRRWLDFRYQLIPYIQACALEAHENGTPVMRAMPFAFPQDPIAWNFEEQYMFGPALLVAPVLQPGGDIRIFLPTGGWFDLWTGERLEGPRLIEKAVPLDQIPVYGREGSLLPLGPSVQHTGELEHGAQFEQIWAFGKPQSELIPAGLPFDSMDAYEYLPEHMTKHNIVIS